MRRIGPCRGDLCVRPPPATPALPGDRLKFGRSDWPVLFCGGRPLGRPAECQKTVKTPTTGRKRVTRGTQEGFLSFSIRSFQNFKKVLKTCSGWRKHFFDSLGAAPLGGPVPGPDAPSGGQAVCGERAAEGGGPYGLFFDRTPRRGGPLGRPVPGPDTPSGGGTCAGTGRRRRRPLQHGPVIKCVNGQSLPGLL